MLATRIIPCLLIRDGGLVKTIQFSNPKYVGDPLNAVKIFNEKEVDELIILDIDASTLDVEPNYALIKKIALECRMPLCYGGGIKTADQAEKIIQLGVEKIAIGSGIMENQAMVQESSRRLGLQSIVAIMDVKKTGLIGRHEVFVSNGRLGTKMQPVDYAGMLNNCGVGEIIVNSIDRDGTMTGYDIDLIKTIRSKVNMPITALGGAGSLEHIKKLLSIGENIGAAAGSFFVFKGRHRAVLIQYPAYSERQLLRSH